MSEPVVYSDRDGNISSSSAAPIMLVSALSPSPEQLRDKVWNGLHLSIHVQGDQVLRVHLHWQQGRLVRHRHRPRRECGDQQVGGLWGERLLPCEGAIHFFNWS